MIEDWVKEKMLQGLKDCTMPLEALKEFKMERLRRIIGYVKDNSPYYRMKYQGVHPHTLLSPEDFTKIAFTLPEEVAAQGPGMLCVSQNRVERIVTQRSGGTTGQMKRICFSETDQERTLDFFGQGLKEMGLFPGDAMFVLFPCRRPGSVGELLCRAGRTMGVIVYPRESVSGWDEAVRFMEKNQVDCILGLPGQVLALAEMTQGAGRRTDIQTYPRVKSVLLSADYVPDGLRRRIELLWGTRIYEHYGMTEMGFAGGMSGATGDSYCLRTPDLYFEIVDELGRPVPPGRAGEVVFTSLTAQAMPLIRYRTGDIAAWKDRGNQADGVMHMGKVRGRLHDGVRCPDGWLLNTAGLDDIIFSGGMAVHYKACYTDGRPGLLEITLYTIHGHEGKSGIPEGTEAALEEMLSDHGVHLKLRREPFNMCTIEWLGKKRIEEVIS